MTDKTPERRVEHAFGEAAAEYDAWIRQALPTYDDVFTTAVEAIPFPPDAAIEVADLGAGTGLFAKLVHDAFPNARITLTDASNEMLAIARARFAETSGTVALREERLEDFTGEDIYDAVVSSLAIHHLDDDAKRALFRRIYKALKPGGVFVNVDQVKGEGRYGPLYWETWLRQVRRSGAPEHRIEASIARRREFDKDATLAEQLRWLADAGFEADILYKHYFVAVFAAVKAA